MVWEDEKKPPVVEPPDKNPIPDPRDLPKPVEPPVQRQG
jgi:hypothetical protein